MAKKAKKPETEAEGGESAPAAEGAEGEKKSGIKALLGNKLVIIGLGAVLLLGGGGAGAWFMFFKKKPEGDAAAEAAKAPPKKTAFVDMKEMIVNISGNQAGERQNFIKVKVSLEVSDAKAEGDIKPLLPRVEDMFLVYLRELRPQDLEGSASTFRLREELLKRVNMALHPTRVDAIVFRELLVQ
jgi:flagellar FliL protein